MVELRCLLIFAQGRGSQWDAVDQDVSKEKGLKRISARTSLKMLCARARAGSA